METGYCQPPPPGCPRNIYKLMVDCWWVQQWLASQNLKLSSVTGGYILWGKYNWRFYAVTCRWASTFKYFITCVICNAYSQRYLLSGNSVQKPNQMSCLLLMLACTTVLSPEPAHLNSLSTSLYTLCVYTLIGTRLQPIISPHSKSPGTQNTTIAQHLKTSLGSCPQTLKYCWAGVNRTKQPLPKPWSWELLWREGSISTKNCRTSTSSWNLVL